MWTRAELKTRAKAVLKENYWKAFGVSMLLLIAGNLDSRGPTYEHRSSGSAGSGASIFGIHSDRFADFLPFLGMLGVLVFLSVILYRIFIGYHLEVGCRKFFIDASQGMTDMKALKRAFDRRWYLNVAKTMVIKGLYILAWTLLLIIPGVIKMYAYRFVPYLLAENPELSPSRALEISDSMTVGHKMDMFILDLSFIGWFLLGALAIGIGVLFVHPYVNATMAELYFVLRKDALDQRIMQPHELTPSESYY